MSSSISDRYALRRCLEPWLERMERCTVYRGHARFLSPREVQVGEDRIAKQIFINVGGRALVPNLPAIDRLATLTNTSILALDTLPEHLVVVGGSARSRGGKRRDS
jgi:pyruvate/2-oxoglutarate dehydrogenase complex dihydrolipoamide dehydrogenase (E3) component